MAGQDVVIAGQLIQPLEGLEHLGEAAAAQVTPAAGAGEQGVAAEQHVLHLEHHAAGRVAGGMEHLDGQLAQRQLVALAVVVQIGDLSGQGEQVGARPVGVFLVDIDLGIGQGLVQLGHGGGVVVVAVGQENILHLQIPQGEGGENSVGLVTGIDDGGLVGGLVDEQIAVGADGADL